MSLEEINSLFQKWMVLADKYSKNQPDNFTCSHLEMLQNEHLPRCKNLDNVYHNLNQWYNSDLKNVLGLSHAHLQLSTDIASLKKPKKNWFLVTVGFNDEEIKGREPAIITTAHRKILDIAGMEYLAHSIEKHRKDKNQKIYIHHHIHYVVKTDCLKSKVIQFFFQKVQKLGVSTKNFIDVSQNGTIDTALKYVSGDKVVEKLECVALDIKWRADTGLDKI